MVVTLPLLRRSCNPLVRAVSLLLGVALIGLLLLFGLAVAGVLLVGGGLWLVWRQWQLRRAMAHAPAAHASPPPEVLEGEFVVIRQDRPAAH